MKKAIALLFLSLYASFTYACTTFLLHNNGQYFFGRNYDFVTANGLVVINSRDVKKSVFGSSAAAPLSWTARYGSVTFNQFGKEFPQGGMNEQGLVVELMWLDGTQYPETDQRTGLSELQWIQYALDNCATVAEVIGTDKQIRIEKTSAPLHFLVADASGNAATIEFLNGQI
ncbi:MAG: linear amide C-N hydrolase, partial [Chitinophagaceae bacterium]|nr:linear amide C-N hydrolase [Chitinophagaceae bacterium]